LNSRKKSPSERHRETHSRVRTVEAPLPGQLLSCLGIVLVAFSLAACGSTEEGDQPDPGDGPASPARLVEVAEFDRPVEVRAAPDFPDLMFVVEQTGRVMVVRRGEKLERPFLDISESVRSGGEMGLLSIAFPDDYRTSGRFYVYYSTRDGRIAVDEHRRRTALVGSTSGRRVIRIPHPDHDNHYGGQMHFLDNLLYFGTGDGGGANDPANNAQGLDTLLGKMVRIDPRPSRGRPYSVPESNPLVGRDGRDEIFASGLRNPFRWSFVKRPGEPIRMAIADVGQSRYEEINFPTLEEARGGNFGWPNHEGPDTNKGDPIPDRIDPVLSLPHPSNCSVIGGVVVRDRRLSLRGRYVFADFCRPRLLETRLTRDGAGPARGLDLAVPRVTSLAEDNRLRVWVTSLEGGLYRLAPDRERP
jgi:glucose/arabinose dehydrogenase